MTNIKFLKNRIIIDGHADTKQECETITLLCDNLAKSKDFKTVRYKSGYAEFVKVGKANDLKFASGGLPIIMYFDSHITKVTAVYGYIDSAGHIVKEDEILATWTTSGQSLGEIRQSSLYIQVYCEDGYQLDTAVVSGNSETSVNYFNGNSFILYQSGGADTNDQIITISSEQTAVDNSKHIVDLSLFSAWANLSNGEHSITVKVKASGYADSAASNAVSVTVTKAASVQYYGTATPLSQARDSMGATTVGNYALFGGGNYNGYKNVVDAYDASLTRTIPTPLSVARSFAAATTVGNYALFGGGGSNDTTFATVDAYNASLTRSIPTPFEKARTHVAATTVGNYALFCGGNLNLNNRTDEMDAYDTSLTKAILAPYSNEITNLAATTIGNYALFGGGRYNGYTDIVNAYDASLTRTLPTVLSVGRESLSAATVGNYALFGGGWNLNNSSNVVDAYDASLTRTTPTALSAARRYITTTTVGGFALFAGGNYGEGSTVDAYDVNLTRTLPTPLPNADYWFGGATIGNYALFAGGYSNDDEVNVYTVA